MSAAGGKKDAFKPGDILRAFAVSVLIPLLFGLPIFLCAGTLEFLNAWLFIGIFDVSVLVISMYLAVNAPRLFEKRMKLAEEDRSHTIIKALLTASLFIALAVSGLDFRFHWSKVPLVAVIVSAAMEICGAVMLFFAMKQNAFGSNTVEIQEGQKIIDTGLYSVVRHPMYLAFMILFCVSPIVLGSFYALIPALCMPFLVAVRIRKEEILLEKELKGYDAYMRKVRYRLIPFIW